MKKTAIVIVILLSIFAVNAWFSFDKEIKGDLISFFTAARAINENGKLEHYSGELEQIPSLWHPPLYIHILALTMRVFPAYLPATRLLGIICLLITCWLMFLLCKEVDSQRGKDSSLFLSAIIILAGCPLFIQGAFVFDIDYSILPVLMLIFMLAYVKFTIKQTIGRTAILVFIFALVLWAKLTTPLILPITIMFYHAVRKEWRMVFKLLLIFISALLIFIFTWWLYSEIFAANYSYPFTYTLKGKFLTLFSSPNVNHIGLVDSLKSRIQTVRWDILLVTPIITISYFAIFFKRLVLFFKRERLLGQRDLLNLIAIGIIGGYFIMFSGHYTIAKYIYPALPMVAIIIALEVKETFEKIINLKQVISLSLILLGVIMGSVVFPEVLSYNFSDQSLKYKLLSMLFYSIPFGLVLFPLVNNKSIKLTVFSTILVISLLYNTGLGASQCLRQSISDMTPTIPIPEKGFTETVKYLSLLDDSSLLVCHKDIGYYWPGKYIEIYDYPIMPLEIETYGRSRQDFMNYIRNSGPNYIVTSSYRQSPVQDSIIVMCQKRSYEKITEIGSFSIYKAAK